MEGANNTVVANYAYDAFGNLLPSTSENQTSLPIENPLRYRGMQGYLYVFGMPGTDVNTQHYFYTAGARTYDSGTGRWIQEDPIVGITADPMSFNRYLYCDANPVLNADPSGLKMLIWGRINQFQWCVSTDFMNGPDIFDLFDLGLEGAKGWADATGKDFLNTGDIPLGSVIKCFDQLFPKADPPAVPDPPFVDPITGFIGAATAYFNSFLPG